MECEVVNVYDGSDDEENNINTWCNGTDAPKQVDYGIDDDLEQLERKYTCKCGNDISSDSCSCTDDINKNNAIFQVGETKSIRYNLKQLWQFYDEPYGLEVPIIIRGECHNVYFVPHLSALQLYNEGHPRPIFEFFETLTPDLRYPLIDKVEELARDYPPLLDGDSGKLDRQSWYSIAWYPILCHNETMNFLKGQLITYHHFEPSHKLIDYTYYFNALERSQSIEEALASCNSSEMQAERGRYYAPIIGFLPYKVRNDTWFLGSNGSLSRHDSFEIDGAEDGEIDHNIACGNRQGSYLQAPLYLVRACKNMLFEMQINHPDFQHVIQNFRELAQL